MKTPVSLVRTALLAALALLLIYGVFPMTQDSAPLEHDGPEGIAFTRHCIGRFELELPDDMRLTRAKYVQPQFSVRIHPGREKANGGLFRGEQRVQDWLEFVEAKRLRHSSANAPTRYVHRDLEPEVKTVIYYQDLRNRISSNHYHRYATFFFKDFPEQQFGVSINNLADEFIPRSEPDVEALLKQRLNWAKRAMAALQWQPWPHLQTGICLPGDLLVANPRPLKTEDGKVRENYGAEFANGRRSMLEMSINVYTDTAQLKETMGRVDGMLAFLATRKMTVAGRKGRLFISDGRYSASEREFRWVSIDTQVNSVRYAHIEIEGAIEIKDYPQLAPLNATEVVMALLRSVQVRKAGMVGVKE